ncbi:ubiquinone anaerobic biosynthesis accessory factor UbiT [Aliiroseovarius sp. CAU 1755]|uniref:ubiquinone anaerobic biosynthesis accessory factor UbiT n=1 Tax=Aliiroseovarius sp. S1339 TaxID=2936990 RepID=UPI0020BED7D5|nr:SCP2 sterol-binding domain-containing protein [Aliiroseovarius sp. S1339]MCK8465103.1 SCP2 sterol-binding domain-containing protein [Aliiroseovarius sp. S1339]
MQDHAVQLPVFPRLPAFALRGLPLTPISLALGAFARRMATRHPSMFKRLGDYSNTRFVLDPTDLPVTLLLEPRAGHPRLRLSRKPMQGDARIAGPLSGLLGMVHGAYDGDALFFSRDLVIEGDTAAVLALRNAIDDAELDLAAEAGAMSGPFAPQVKRLIGLAETKTGVALSRHEEDPLW